jgi:hypothetical protein
MIFIFLIITINNFIFITKSNNKMGNCSSNAPAAYAVASPVEYNDDGKCTVCGQKPRSKKSTLADAAAANKTLCPAIGCGRLLETPEQAAQNAAIRAASLAGLKKHFETSTTSSAPSFK